MSTAEFYYAAAARYRRLADECPGTATADRWRKLADEYNELAGAIEKSPNKG
jgi:hypothetical protein